MHTLTETLTAGLLLIHSGFGGGPPWADGDDGMFWGPWLLVPFLFWIAFGVFVAWIVTRLFPSRSDGGAASTDRRDPAEEILRERFARGEVTPEEYRRSLKILRGETPQDIADKDDEQGTNA